MSHWILRIGIYDERLLGALVSHRRRVLDRFMSTVTHAGDAGVVVGIVVLLWVGGLHLAATQAAVALAVSHAASQLLKSTVARPRPRLPVGPGALIQPPDRFSFPSGHASASLAVALPLALALGWPLGCGGLFLGAAVGVSRCYLGVHYPTDVAAGWLLAVGSVTVSVLLV